VAAAAVSCPRATSVRIWAAISGAEVGWLLNPVSSHTLVSGDGADVGNSDLTDRHQVLFW
jgi:hypothetical protein